MMTPGSSLVKHLPGGVLHAVEHTTQGHGLNGFPFLAGELGQRRNDTKTGAVDHDIQRPKCRVSRAHRAFDLRLVRHVGETGDRAITELAGGIIECGRIQIAEQHARARFDKGRRDGFADARCSAGHDGSLALQEIHVQLSCYRHWSELLTHDHDAFFKPVSRAG